MKPYLHEIINSAGGEHNKHELLEPVKQMPETDHRLTLDEKNAMAMLLSDSLETKEIIELLDQPINLHNLLITLLKAKLQDRPLHLDYDPMDELSEIMGKLNKSWTSYGQSLRIYKGIRSRVDKWEALIVKHLTQQGEEFYPEEVRKLIEQLNHLRILKNQLHILLKMILVKIIK